MVGLAWRALMTVEVTFFAETVRELLLQERPAALKLDRTGLLDAEDEEPSRGRRRTMRASPPVASASE
jgi:hypothetical protein